MAIPAKDRSARSAGNASTASDSRKPGKAAGGVAWAGGGKRAQAGPMRDSVIYMSSTEAQNGFGRVLDTVARNNTVVITKRNENQAVVMSVEQYEGLTGRASIQLDTLTAEFDALLESMQTPEARAGMRVAFRASPEELGRAAVAAAQREGM